MEQGATKVKLLVIYDYLRAHSAEDSPVTTKELCNYLASRGITCHRETLAQDIALLNEYEYEVLTTKKGQSNAYYIPERDFEIGELKILMDAVQAAGFISEERTKELMEKITALAGPHKAKILSDNIICFNTRKHETKSLYANVEVLEQSVEQQKKVGFYYFDHDENRNKKYHHDKKHYLVDPIALVYSTDNYYLLTWNVEESKPYSYRIDRMEAIELTDEPVDRNAVLARDNVAEYTKEVFKMFGGEIVLTTLEFTEKVMKYVYDKFGEDTKIEKVGDDCYRTTVDVQISPTFFGWVSQFAGELRVISPQRVMDQYREHVKKI